MVQVHNCKATGKLGEYIFLCSRCGQCYVCRHKFVLFGEDWKVRHPNGKFTEISFDGRLQDKNHVPDPAGLLVYKSSDEALIDKALKDFWTNGDALEKKASKGFDGEYWIITIPRNEFPGLLP